MVSLSEEGCYCSGGSAGKVYQMDPGAAGLTFAEILSWLRLQLLEFDRTRRDLIDSQQILTGLDRADAVRMSSMLDASDDTRFPV